MELPPICNSFPMLYAHMGVNIEFFTINHCNINKKRSHRFGINYLMRSSLNLHQTLYLQTLTCKQNGNAQDQDIHNGERYIDWQDIYNTNIKHFMVAQTQSFITSILGIYICMKSYSNLFQNGKSQTQCLICSAKLRDKKVIDIKIIKCMFQYLQNSSAENSCLNMSSSLALVI